VHVVSSRDILAGMRTKTLQAVLERADEWPEDIQDALAELALEIDAGLKGGEYEPTPGELAGIDRGLRAASERRFATDEEVEAVFAKFHRR
jgi:predicted transcriptional regulator